MPEEHEAPVVIPVVVPEIVPEEPDNLAYHVGDLRASHDGIRREWETHRDEITQLKALVQTLLDELQSVEEIAEEIAEEDTSIEDTVAEHATVADPVATHSEPERKAHWLVRGLRGH